MFAAGATDELKKINPDVRYLPVVLGTKLLEACHHVGNIYYRLACYECQRGHLESARAHLKRTFEIEKRLPAQALEDPVLRPLWDSLSRRSRVIPAIESPSPWPPFSDSPL